MSRTQYDIPFAHDDAHRFLPWLSGAMLGVVALLLCVAVSINGWVLHNQGSYDNTLSVHIPAMGDEGADKIAKVQEVLGKTQGVARVNTLSEDTVRGMLKPWFGSGSASEGLPFPTVIEVTMIPAGSTTENYEQMRKTLSAIIPDIELDAQKEWVANFSSFSRAVQQLVAGLALFIVALMALIIAFAARASLKLNKRTVHLLHSMGAEDSYIARQFQQVAARQVLQSGVVGCLVGALAFFAMGYYVESLHVAFIPSFKFEQQHLGVLLLLPLVCALVAWLTTSFTVRRQLQRVL